MATTSPERIVTLDIIRGVAVMGIFSVNIIAFSMIEAAYGNPAAYGGRHGADLFVWAANLIVIDGKMRTLFSMLFGASTLLVIDRAVAGGQSGAKVHYARMAVLFVIGLIHYHLIWWGDILTLYAATGMIAYFFRNRSVKALIGWGIAFMLAGAGIFAAIVTQMWQADLAAHAPGASRAAIRAWNDFASMMYPTARQISDDLALHRGSWSGLAYHYLVTKAFEWIPGLVLFIPETLGLMLFGMAGYRSGFLTGQWENSLYRSIAVYGLTIGALASALLIYADLSTRFYAPVVLGGFIVWLAPFRVVMAAGYAALIVLLSRPGGWLATRLAAVGRAAFTNYLGTSIIATFVFYGWGLGLYGHVSRAQAWLLVPVVWLVMLAWSKPWLDRFQYGPLEWVWRTLARGELQPMRKRPRVSAAAAEA
jgi:uncharacterized protein